MKMKAIYHSGRKESVFYEQGISFQKQNRDEKKRN